MRLTTVLLIVSLMQVSAASFGQLVSISRKNVELKEVFKEIHRQSGYDFIYEIKNIPSTKVDVSLKNATVEQVLANILSNQPITYEISNRDITIKRKEVSFLDRIKSAFSAIDVRGQVVDSTGTPLPGAIVRLKNSNNVMNTNAEGRFALSGVQPGDVIVITYIGYATREVTITGENATNLRIVMTTDVSKLAEVDVVSTGYQNLPRERSAGSFAKVDMDVVANRTISMNVLQSLDGLVPGLVINNAPLKNQVLIRGLSTVSGAGNLPNQSTTAQPLYVVDGLPVPASNDYDNLPEMILNLNPQDVESITVLKDATAASIWGSRAANGVIVIKTKRGTFNSKLRVNYNTFVNFQGKPDLDYIPTLNSQQYVQTGIELFNAGHTEWRTLSSQYSGGGVPPLELILYNQERGLISADRASFQLDSLSKLDNRSQIKDLFYRNALLTNHTVSLSGGGDKYSFYGSTSYTNTVSNIPGEKNQNAKINLRQDFKPTNFLNLYIITDISNNIASAKRNYNVNYFSTPYQMYQDADGNNLNIPHLTDLSDSLRRDVEGRSRMNLAYNPMDEFDRGRTNRDALMARLNGGFNVDIYKGLRFEGTYGYSKGKNRIRDFESLQSFTVRKEIAQFAVAATPATAPKYYIPATGGQLTTINGDQHTWDIRNQLTYDNTFGKHQVTFLGGQEAREEFSTSLSSKVRGFDETLLTHANVDWATIVSPIMGTAWPNVANVASAMLNGNDSFRNSETTNRFTSYFANLAYTFDRRYSVNASWRNDQSNLFGKDKSAQNKPIWSIGGRWNISNEQFMEPVGWLDRLSVRATYGILGLSPNSGVAASQDITGPIGSAFFPGSIGLRVITPGNPNLSWERTATRNFGLDFSIFRERLSGNVEFYNKSTTDLIGIVFPNTLTGFVSITGNQGNLNNKGIEASLSSDNIRSRNFTWSTTLNFAHNKNKLIKVNRTAPIITGAAQVVAGAVENYPLFSIFAYQYAGLSDTGAPMIYLADGTQSAARNISKPEDIEYMGTGLPVWNGGLGNTFRYRNVRLSANLIFNMGHVMRRDRYVTINRPLKTNVHPDFLNRWKVPGDEANTNIPGLVNATANDYDYFASGNINVVDASFAKFRDITLFYELPKSLTNRIRAQNISIRAQMSNIMLWKGNEFGIDPEFVGGLNMALRSNQNTFSVGANISF